MSFVGSSQRPINVALVVISIIIKKRCYFDLLSFSASLKNRAAPNEAVGKVVVILLKSAYSIN